MVVVRAGEALAGDLQPHGPGRRRMQTLLGLDQRERLDTLWDELASEQPPASGLRPVVLVDGIDDDLAEEYRREAERILQLMKRVPGKTGT
jgi:hypothetical protein